MQRKAYPDVVPLQVELPVRAAFDTARKVIDKRKWLEVVDARPPAGARRDGVIEAVARTTIMGFRDDVVVRVTPMGAGTRIDVRSASRDGSHDFGANAWRVRSLLEDIDDAVGTVPEPRPPPGEQSAAEKGTPARSVSRPGDKLVDGRRAVGPDQTAHDQILQMREHRQAGGAGQPRIDADINRAHDGGDIGRALAGPVQNRGLARLAVQNVVMDEARRIRDRGSVAGEVKTSSRRASLSREAM